MVGLPGNRRRTVPRCALLLSELPLDPKPHVNSAHAGCKMTNKSQETRSCSRFCELASVRAAAQRSNPRESRSGPHHIAVAPGVAVPLRTTIFSTRSSARKSSPNPASASSSTLHCAQCIRSASRASTAAAGTARRTHSGQRPNPPPPELGPRPPGIRPWRASHTIVAHGAPLEQPPTRHLF